MSILFILSDNTDGIRFWKKLDWIQPSDIGVISKTIEPQTTDIMLKAILWDNDGVLVDTEPLYFRATAQVLEKVGVKLTEELFRELFLTDSGGAWHLAEEKGVPPNHIETLRRERNELYRDLLYGRSHAIDGVEDVLQKLRPLYTMAVVTSSWKEDFELIHRSTHFLRYFDFVLTREDYG